MLNKTLEASASVTVSARRFILSLCLIVLLLILGLSAYNPTVDAPKTEYKKSSVILGKKQFSVAIADTNEKRNKGLGGRDYIAPDEGMLFVFEQSGEYCFWMKDVDFSIDILWFDESYELVHEVLSVHPESYPKSFCPPRSALYVLEIKGGETVKLNDRSLLEIEHML